MLDNTYVGKRLAEYRESRGFSAAEIAALLALTTDQYRKIESGRISLKAHHLWILSIFFSVSAGELLQFLVPEDARKLLQ